MKPTQAELMRFPLAQDFLWRTEFTTKKTFVPKWMHKRPADVSPYLFGKPRHYHPLKSFARQPAAACLTP